MQRGNRWKRKKIEREGDTEKDGNGNSHAFCSHTEVDLVNKRNSRSESDKGGQVTSDEIIGTKSGKNLKD